MQTQRELLTPQQILEKANAPERLTESADNEQFSTSATQFQLILDRQQEWQARLRMVDAAREFLYISTYYIEYDDYAITFLAALKRAVSRGVRVYLLVDGFGQTLSSNLMTADGKKKLRALLDDLRAGGAKLIFYRPPKLLQRLIGSGYHIKYQVSEQRQMLFSSSNISQMSFNRWMEFSALLEGPVVAAMLNDLFQVIPQPMSADLEKVLPAHEDTMRNGHLPYSFEFLTTIPANDPSPLSPFVQQRKNPITSALVEHINAARSSVVLTSFYFKPHPRLVSALLAATRRGVRVEIHHSHRGALGGVTRLPWLSASARYPVMLDAGFVIYEHELGQHTKFVLIDDRIAWLGSYNFEHSADDRLAEAMLVTEDVRIVQQLQLFFQQLRTDTKNGIFSRDDFDALPHMLRFYRLLCLPFKRWL